MTHFTLINDAKVLIDQYLTQLSGRTLVEASEVSDLLLDIRLTLGAAEVVTEEQA